MHLHQEFKREQTLNFSKKAWTLEAAHAYK